MGATSAGSIQMDLEVKSDLDEDIQAEASKLADRIRKQVDSMSGDMFKNLRKSLVASLDKMTEAVKSCLDRTKLEMRAFVEQMASMVKQMSGVQMPYQKAQSDTEPNTTASQGPSVRGPPGISIRKPKVKFDPQFDTEMFRQKYAELENMMDMYDNQILAKQAQRKTLLESYKPNMSAQAESALDKQVMGLDAQIAKLQDAAARTNITLSAMDRQMGATSGTTGQTSASISKLASSMGGLKGKIASAALNGMRKGLQLVRSAARGAGSAIAQFTKCLASSALHKFSNGLKSAGQHAASFASRLLGIGSAGKKASNGMGRAHMGVGQLIKSFTIFSLIFPLVSRGIMALAQNIGATLMTNTAFANSLNQIRSNLATAFTPIFQAIMPALNALMSALATVTGYIAAFMSALFGKSMASTKQATSGIYAAKDAMGAYGSSADKAAKASEKARRSLMGFDEINKLDDADNSAGSGGGGGGGSDMPVYTPTDVDDGPIKKWVKQLKDLWAKGDYDGIGKLIGQQVNKAVASFTKWISWDNLGKSITEFCDGFCELFNSLIDTINWENIGRMFGTGINTIVNTLYLLFTGINWERIGKALAQGLNGLVYSVDWDKLGHTIGSFLQAHIDALYGFVTTADWPAIGKALADGVMGLVYSVDLPKFTESLGKGLSGAISSVHTFVENINWTKLGDTIAKSINTFFSNINWADFGMTLSDAALGILDTLLTALQGIDWGQIGKSIGTFLSNIDWWGIISKVGSAIWEAFSGVITSLFNSGSGTVFLALLAGIKGLKSVFSMVDLKGAALNFVSGGLKSLASLGTGILKDVLPKVASGVQTLLGSGGLGKIVSGATGIVAKAGPILSSIGSVVFSPTGLLIGGVAAGVALIVTHWDDIKKAAKNVAKWVGEKWDDVKKWTSEKWGKISKNLSDTWDDLKEGAGKTWEGIKSTVCKKLGLTKEGVAADTKTMFNTMSSIGDDIKNVVGNKSKSTADKFGENMKAMKTSATDKTGDIKTIITKKLNEVASWMSTTGKINFTEKSKLMMNGAKNSAKNVDIKSAVKSSIDKALNWIRDSAKKTAESRGKSMMLGMSDGTKKVSIKSAVETTVNKATSWLKELKNLSPTWGKDMMSGMSDGMRNATYLVSNAASNAANIISQWLHFSRPDVGPLREYEKWMPDMMQGLSSTLESSTPTFINRVKTLATSMSSAMQASLQEPTIAFAGERSLNVQHAWKEERQSSETSLGEVVEEIKSLKQKFDEIKQAVESKDTDIYMDSEKVTKKVVDNVNKDTRKNGKCPIDI